MFALRWVADRMHESRRPFRSSRVSRALPRNEQIACQIACLARRVFWRVLGARSGFGAPRGPPRTVLKGELCVLGSSLADSTSRMASAALDGNQRVPFQVLAASTQENPTILIRECVDCGLLTGRFCDDCYAAERFPLGDANGSGLAQGQLTPLCSSCDNWRDGCRYCRDIWVTKPVPTYRNYNRPIGSTGGRNR